MREIKACSGVSASAKLRINLYFANVMIEFFRKMAGECSKVGERGGDRGGDRKGAGVKI